MNTVTKLKKATITASKEELLTDGLWPQFCQPGQLIFIKSINEDCQYAIYCTTPGGVEKTINVDFFEYEQK